MSFSSSIIKGNKHDKKMQNNYHFARIWNADGVCLG